MSKENKNKIIEVFSGTLWEAQILTSLLQDEGIESFLKNSVLNHYAYNPSFAQQVKIMISKSDVQAAEKIIKRFIDNSIR